MSSDSERIARLEEELARTRELVFQMGRLAETGKLIAVVAHELSQPLLGIKAFAQMLQRHCSDDEFVGPKVEIIVQQAKIMEGIIDSLRQFTSHRTFESGGVDLPQVISNAVELFHERARKSKVRISTDLAERLPRTRGTSGHLQQVVINLLSNALDELESSGAGRVLVRSLQDSDGWIIMRVADTGGGVPEEVRPQLFDPFYTTKGEEKGTGLGLSICRDILKVHGGEIRLMDPEEIGDAFGIGYGTAFEVRLPAAANED